MNNIQFIYSKNQLIRYLNELGVYYNEGYGFPAGLIPYVVNILQLTMVDDITINCNYISGTTDTLLMLTKDSFDLLSDVKFPLTVCRFKNPRVLRITHQGSI